MSSTWLRGSSHWDERASRSLARDSQRRCISSGHDDEHARSVRCAQQVSDGGSPRWHRGSPVLTSTVRRWRLRFRAPPVAITHVRRTPPPTSKHSPVRPALPAASAIRRDTYRHIQVGVATLPRREASSLQTAEHHRLWQKFRRVPTLVACPRNHPAVPARDDPGHGTILSRQGPSVGIVHQDGVPGR